MLSLNQMLATHCHNQFMALLYNKQEKRRKSQFHKKAKKVQKTQKFSARTQSTRYLSCTITEYI